MDFLKVAFYFLGALTVIGILVPGGVDFLIPAFNLLFRSQRTKLCRGFFFFYKDFSESSGILRKSLTFFVTSAVPVKRAVAAMMLSGVFR